ncbi:monovalent cation/H+ antiporter complex subunit F [Fusibacter sp. JL298sf-3]
MKIVMTLLTFYALLSAVRILKGPSLWDRLLALNLLTAKIIMIMIVFAYVKDLSMILDTALIYALLSFIGILFIALYVQKKGRY